MFNCCINKVDKFHFLFEGTILFELTVGMIYFFNEILYFFRKVNWSMAVIHNLKLVYEFDKVLKKSLINSIFLSDLF